MDVSTTNLIRVANEKGYKIFDNDTKNHNINIWGIRHRNPTSNSFDDLIVVFWKFLGKWTLVSFPCTTDPGRYWLEHPLNVNGTGIMKEGQWKGLWKIGMHQGKYKALVQVSPVTLIRDNDKDSEIDYDATKLDTGLFGVNCHRANENGKSVSVDKWSAACQVLQNREIFNPENNAVKVFEFDYFMHLCELAAERFGNSFTYTLIRDTDL